MPIEPRTLATLHDERRGLSLLLVLSSAGCLGLPRYGDDTEGEPSATTQPPSTDTTDTADTADTTDTANTTNTTREPTPDFGLPATTVAPPDVGNEPYATCQAYAALAERCYGNYGGTPYEYCVEYVQYIEANFPECAPLFEDFLVCLSSLDCEQLGGGGGATCNALIEAFFECQQGG